MGDEKRQTDLMKMEKGKKKQTMKGLRGLFQKKKKKRRTRSSRSYWQTHSYTHT